MQPISAPRTRLYSLNYNEIRTYLVAAMFVAGNIILPQLVHLIPQGGHIWLPIYLFTLIGAYKYGWKAGLLTALASPVINSFLFGMPMIGALPAIMLKSVLLALFAGITAQRTGKASILMIAAVVLGYQVAGTAGEWLMCGNLHEAISDFRIGIPGILVQIFGGWAVINYLIRK